MNKFYNRLYDILDEEKSNPKRRTADRDLGKNDPKVNSMVQALVGAEEKAQAEAEAAGATPDQLAAMKPYRVKKKKSNHTTQGTKKKSNPK
jgi:hypothetical protein